MVAEKTYGFTAANLEYAKLIFSCMKSDWWVSHISTDAELQVTARMFGSVLYDIKGLRSGYMSRRALDAVLSGELGVSQLTDEHYHARQTTGRDIIQYFIDHPTCEFEDFAMFLQRKCSVHKVLREENQELKKYQNSGMSWTEEYELAGVELIKIGVERGKNWTKTALEVHADDEPTPLEEAAEELASLYGSGSDD